ASQDLGVGRPAQLFAPTGIFSLPVTGLVAPRGAAAFNGGAIVILPLAKAQAMFALGDHVNILQILVHEAYDTHGVEESVARVLPPGFTVQSPTARSEHAAGALDSAERALTLLSVASLVAGAVVIVNSFLMNLGERRRQLRILRAIGMSRAQVTQLLLREAVLLGCIGTLLGVLAGVGVAILFTRAMEQFLDVALLPLHFTPRPLVVALIVGPGVTLAATYLPAR